MKKIIFLSNPDNPHSSVILEELAKSKDVEVGLVITSTKLTNNGIYKIIKTSGLRYFLMRVQEGLYFKYYRIFKFIGIDYFKETKLKKVKDIIKEDRLPFLETGNINGESILKRMEEENPDFIVCCIFNQILKKHLLKKYNCINIHGAKLPQYRGVSATFMVLANNEKETGITIHKMTEEIDKGNILIQRTVPIRKDDTIFSLIQRMMYIIKDDVIEILLKNPTGISITNNGFYCSHPTKDDVKKFVENGRRLF